MRKNGGAITIISPSPHPFWEEVFGRGFVYGLQSSPVVEAFFEIFKEEPKQRILGIGCGYGRDEIALALDGQHVIGVDMSEKGIELARSLYKKNKESIKVSGGSCVFIQDNFSSASLKNAGVFDVIVANRFFHFLSSEEREKFVHVAAELLEPYGRLILSARSNQDFNPETMQWIEGEEGERAEYIDKDIRGKSGIPFLNEDLLYSAFSRNFIIEKCYSVVENVEDPRIRMKLRVMVAQRKQDGLLATSKSSPSPPSQPPRSPSLQTV